mgnify:FL=1
MGKIVTLYFFFQDIETDSADKVKDLYCNLRYLVLHAVTFGDELGIFVMSLQTMKRAPMLCTNVLSSVDYESHRQ